MIVLIAAAVAMAALGLIFFVRQKDLPQPAGVAPWKHLEGRKASIYENLRDLQFEYRLGKLSDADYQQTKTDLQAELATVLAEIDRLKSEEPAQKQASGCGCCLRNRRKSSLDTPARTARPLSIRHSGSAANAASRWR